MAVIWSVYKISTKKRKIETVNKVFTFFSFKNNIHFIFITSAVMLPTSVCETLSGLYSAIGYNILSRVRAKYLSIRLKKLNISLKLESRTIAVVKTATLGSWPCFGIAVLQGNTQMRHTNLLFLFIIFYEMFMLKSYCFSPFQSRPKNSLQARYLRW